MKNLENVKVGDWIKLQVTKINGAMNHSIIVKGGVKGYEILSFNLKGEFRANEGQIAFPCEEPAFQERWMMVSYDNEDWRKRKVFMLKNGKYIAWVDAITDEEVDTQTKVMDWDFAKEIEEPKILTLEERVAILESKLNKH